MSVLSMACGEEGKRESLNFRLIGSQEPLGAWGHEHVRHLAMEIGQEYLDRMEKDASTEDICKLALEIVPFFLTHNADADACDLLMETEQLVKIVDFVDKNNYSRIALYLSSCVNYLPYPDDIDVLKIVHKLHKKMANYPQMTLTAMRLNDMALLKQEFDFCPDPLLKKQLAFMIARNGIFFQTEDESLNEILRNLRFSEYFVNFAKDIGVIEPKTPEDIYKTHLENTKDSTVVDSARHNLASTFVNAFVNAGFSTDKLMKTADPNSSWIYKNKGEGMLSASASLGCIMMWNIEEGLTEIDKYLYSNDPLIKAGALLGIGILNCGVQNESDPALALLSEALEVPNSSIRRSAIMGLGIAYAGTARSELMDLLLPIISDSTLEMELVSVAALSLGQIFVGTCNGDITSTILQTLMERSEEDLKSKFTRFLCLGLALLFLGQQENADATIETLKVVHESVSKSACVLTEICAYAGTGNVLKIQSMLHHCNEHISAEKEDGLHQSFAVLGVAIIAMGEDIGQQMALRTFNHLMHYGEANIRRMVPLALSLLYTSYPQMNIIDTLSKYSHDNDAQVAVNAIFSMGLVGSGTNNARLSQLLRQLASYYHKDANCLFMVRLAQGLVHAGKGAVTFNPYHSGRTLMSLKSVSGLLSGLMGFTDVNHFMLGNHHYLLYQFVLSFYPRYLITLNEELKSVPITVRIGQAVDVVGQAGRPKTITGFQTHSTPALMSYSERAEFATEEFLGLTSVLEGIVITRPNPEHQIEMITK